MRIITIQDKAVLDILNKTGIYALDDEALIAPNLIRPYKFMMEEYRYAHFPIFGCPVGFKCNFYGAIEDLLKAVILELEIPEDKVKFQSYYNWSDFIYYSEYPDEFYSVNQYPGTLYDFGQDILNPSDENQVEIAQVTFEEISSDMLVKHIPFKDAHEFYNKYIFNSTKYELTSL